MLLSCDHGTMIVNRFDCDKFGNGQSRWLMDHGNVGTEEADACIQSILDVTDPVIFDVGSNIGTWLTWVAHSRPNASIYAFEPQPQVFQIMCGNLAINNIYNVLAYPMALGAESKWIEVDEPNYATHHDFGVFSLVEQKIPDLTARKLHIEIRTVDQIMRDFAIPKLDLMKIDVEGMDIDVLRGAANTINRYRPVIFIEHSDNRRSVKADIQAHMDQYQYSYQQLGNNLLCRPL